MKAQVIHQFGDPSVFNLEEIAIPKLQQGEVLVKVYATSVNQIDCKIRQGLVPKIAPDSPAILHGDVAGVISEVADDVIHFKVGDEVYGCAGGLKGSAGALAEYMPVDAKLLAHKPKSLSMLETAALPLVSITAWEALFKKTTLKAGQTVLIHGGVGGVGHIAIQLAKYCGAHVFTTVLKEQDYALAKTLGANEIINPKEEEVDAYVQRLTQGKGFEVVFDTVGGSNLDKSLQAAAIEGLVIATAARSTHDLSPMHNKALGLHVVFMLLPILTHQHREKHGAILSELNLLIDGGKLRPLVDPKQFTLAQVADAHAYVESGQARGKVVIKVS